MSNLLAAAARVLRRKEVVRSRSAVRIGENVRPAGMRVLKAKEEEKGHIAAF
jgi:hypothetical protein